MVPILSLCPAANSTRSGRRAIVPSSRMISHRTAAGASPASRARSQQASVWPARTSTPPGWAISGKTWPGWTISSDFEFSATAAFMVRARSWAEMPVAMPSAASIETVKLVPWRERFCSTIGFKPRRSACVSVIGMQIRPRPCLARKLIFSAARTAEMISAMGLMAAVSRRISRFYSYSSAAPPSEPPASSPPVRSRMRADLPERARR